MNKEIIVLFIQILSGNPEAVLFLECSSIIDCRTSVGKKSERQSFLPNLDESEA